MESYVILTEPFFLQGCSNTAFVHAWYLVVHLQRCTCREDDGSSFLFFVRYHDKLLAL